MCCKFPCIPFVYMYLTTATSIPTVDCKTSIWPRVEIIWFVPCFIYRTLHCRESDFFKVKEELPKVLSIDGNFRLVRKKTAGTSPFPGHHEGRLFLPQLPAQPDQIDTSSAAFVSLKTYISPVNILWAKLFCGIPNIWCYHPGCWLMRRHCRVGYCFQSACGWFSTTCTASVSHAQSNIDFK